MKTTFILVFALICCGIGAMGQVHKGFTWIGPDHALYAVDLKTGLLTKQSIYKQKVELGKIKGWDSLKKEIPGDVGINTFYQADSIFVAIPGTGQLYSLQLAELKLSRLDQTFFRGYNFNAAQFIRKDTLFSIGGEGFWHRHSVITYYNPKIYEWDLYPSGKSNQHPTDFKFSGYAKANDAFFSAYLATDSVLEGKQIYFTVFDFKHKKWEVKGKLSLLLVAYAKSKYRSIWTGKYLILYSDKEDAAVYIVNAFDNLLYEFKEDDNHFFTLNREIYFRRGLLFSRSIVSSGNQDKMLLDSVLVASLVKNSTIVGHVYDAEVETNLLYVAVALLVVACTGLIIYRKRKLKPGNIDLNPQEILVVTTFITKFINQKMASPELNDLLQINDKSYDNQRQIRNRIIGTINQKIYVFLGVSDFIFRISNKEDKRIMDYHVNPYIKAKDLIKVEVYLSRFS